MACYTCVRGKRICDEYCELEVFGIVCPDCDLFPQPETEDDEDGEDDGQV